MIALLGDIMVDVIVKVDKYPVEGGEAICEKTSFRLGGSACNTALLLSKMCKDVFLFSQIGKDNYGKIVNEKLRNSILNRKHILDKTENTGYMMIVVSENGQRTMFSSRIDDPVPMNLSYYEQHLRNCDLIHISGYLLQDDRQWKIVREIIDYSYKNGIKISLDPGTSTVKHFKKRLCEVLKYTDIYMPNEYEIYLLTGEKEIDSGLMSMHKYTNGMVIGKCGESGCKYFNGKEIVSITPNCRKKVLSTVGAGDAFNAGFLSSYMKGCSLNKCCEEGNRIAVKIITSNDEIVNIEIDEQEE